LGAPGSERIEFESKEELLQFRIPCWKIIRLWQTGFPQITQGIEGLPINFLQVQLLDQ